MEKLTFGRHAAKQLVAQIDISQKKFYILFIKVYTPKYAKYGQIWIFGTSGCSKSTFGANNNYFDYTYNYSLYNLLIVKPIGKNKKARPTCFSNRSDTGRPLNSFRLQTMLKKFTIFIYSFIHDQYHHQNHHPVIWHNDQRDVNLPRKGGLVKCALGRLHSQAKDGSAIRQWDLQYDLICGGNFLVVGSLFFWSVLLWFNLWVPRCLRPK